MVSPATYYWALSFLLVLHVVVDSLDNSNNALHLQGHHKVKTASGKVFASYGLSPLTASPKRSVDYSPAAVRAASSVARSRSTEHRNNVSQATRETATPSLLHAKIDLRPYLSPVEDQSESNSCAANAVAGAYEYLATRASLRDGEHRVGDISRLFIYYVGRKRDQVNWGDRNDNNKRVLDNGMTLQGAIEAVQLKGAALQASWPFELEFVNHRPPAEAFDEAMRYKVGDAMRIPLDLYWMRQSLNEGYPIIFGLKLTRAFFHPPSDGFIPTPDPSDPQSAEHGLHAMLIVGYNDRQSVFIVRNSWGSHWGVNGYCYLSYDYVVNENFNFVGMFAIQSLTDDDLTPDEDDGTDMERNDDDESGGFDDVLEDFFDELLGSDKDDDEDDWENMFDDRSEALRAFTKFAGNQGDLASHNLLLDKKELKSALQLMGVSMVSDEEIELAFQRYDDDQSGFLNFDEFYDMQEFFEGSLLDRKDRLLHQVEISICHYAKKTVKQWDFLPLFAVNQVSDAACGLTKKVMASWTIPSYLTWLTDLVASMIFPQPTTGTMPTNDGGEL